MIWHSTETTEVLKELDVDMNTGLANGVVDERLDIYGKNIITNVKSTPFFSRFASLLFGKLPVTIFFVILFSLAISYVSKETDRSAYYTPLLILAMIIVSSFFEALHRHNSEKIMNHLHNVTNPEATVLREGMTVTVPASNLVPGDIILLNPGDYITADARLLETTALRCNEASLTDESVPAEKNAGLIFESIAPIDCRQNMVFAGSNVIQGTAKAVVVATGMNTELGHTMVLAQQAGSEMLPLQKMLNNSYKIINFAIAILSFLYLMLGILLHFSQINFAAMTASYITDALVLAYTAVPVGIPVISSVMIALGIERIFKDNILIKKARAAELLGRTTVLCVDKTGILTHKSMQLSAIYNGEKLIELFEDSTLGDKESLLLKLATACSTLDGDATEKAISDSCEKYNCMSPVEIEELFPRLNAIPFDAERKIMTTVNLMHGKPFAISKGAPEVIIEKCINCDKEFILKQNDLLAENGLRIICIAMRPLDDIPAVPVADDIEKEMLFVGLLGFSDPPRNSAIQSLCVCEEAGIKTIMFTGDHPMTARAVARRIGILKDGTELITGTELNELSDAELAENVEKYAVYARISPADKVRIIKAWQNHHELVTATGDSWADADALSTADIGCAIGQYGSDAARGSADIVITGNSFTSIVDAIKESRGLFENIRKSVFYLLTCSFSIVLSYLFGMIIYRSAPVSPVLLLWLGLLIGGAPFLALGFEKAEDSVMKHKPLSLSGHIFDRYSCISGALHTVFITLTTLIAFGVYRNGNLAETMAFTTVTLSQLFHVYNLKTARSVFANPKNLFTSNRFMNLSVGLALFIVLFLIFTPAGFIFGLTVLPFRDFITCFGLAIAIIPFSEIIKNIIRIIRKY